MGCVELARYPAKAGFSVSKKPHHEEIEASVKFLDRIAQLPPGSKDQLDFLQERIQVGVIIVGKREKLEWEGRVPYVDRVRRCQGSGSDIVYLIGVKDAASEIPGIARAAEQKGYAKVKSIRKYHAIWRGGTTVPAFCAQLECKAQPEHVAEFEEPVEAQRYQTHPTPDNSQDIP